MPFRIQPQLFTGPDFVDLDGAAGVTVENNGPADAQLAFDEDGNVFITPLPAGTGKDFPYTGDNLMGRVHFRPVTAGQVLNILVTKRIFVCDTAQSQ